MADFGIYRGFSEKLFEGQTPVKVGKEGSVTIPSGVAPVALEATGIGSTSFTANWEAFPDAYVYLLDVSTSPTFDTFVYENQQVLAPSTSYVVIGLQPNTTYYYRVRASTESVTDPDYQAVLDYATAQGYTLPSESQQALQEQLIIDLKGAGVWNKLDLFYVFATDGDSDFASINWKDPNNFEITEVNSPTFTTNVGFTGNGTSSYLNTNWNVLNDSVNFQQLNATIGAYGVLGATYDVGVRIGYNNSMSCLYQDSDIRLNGGATVAISGQGTHLLQHNRTSSNNVSQCINGALTNSVGSASDPLANLEAYIFGINSNGSPNFFNSNTHRVVYLGANLESEASDIYTAIYTNYLANL